MRVFRYGSPSGPASIEAMHLYRSRPLTRSLETWVGRTPPAEPRDQHVLLVDDQHGEPIWDVADLVEALARNALLPDGIYSEAAFVPLAAALVSGLEGEWVRRGNKTLFLHASTRVALLREDGTPTCPSLVVAWTTCRLGLADTPRDARLWGEPLEACSTAETWLMGADITAERAAACVFRALFPRIAASDEEIVTPSAAGADG